MYIFKNANVLRNIQTNALGKQFFVFTKCTLAGKVHKIIGKTLTKQKFYLLINSRENFFTEN